MACIATPNDNFKAFPTSLLLQIPQIWRGTIQSFLLLLVPQSKPQGSLHLILQAELILPSFRHHTNKDILKRTFSTSLNYN